MSALYVAPNTGSFGSSSLSTADIMHRSGHNVGNFAFWNAAAKLISASYRCIPFGAKYRKEFNDSKFVVVPAANYLNETSDLGWLADLIVELDKPVIVLGLGAQSEHEDRYPNLSEGTVRFVSEASKRTPFLCMRGEYSANLCRSIGVSNVKIVGCPSLFSQSDRLMAAKIASRWNSEFLRVAIHASAIKAHVRPAERKLFKVLEENLGSGYFVQRPRELMKIILREELTEADLEYLARVSEFLAPEKSFNEFCEVIARYGVIPYSTESWQFDLRAYSHSLGTRIHGAMMSMAAFLPTICISHDTRTRELCEVMKIPTAGHKDVARIDELSRIFDEIRFDASEFEDNRSSIAKVYFELFRGVGVDAARELRENFC